MSGSAPEVDVELGFTGPQPVHPHRGHEPLGDGRRSGQLAEAGGFADGLAGGAPSSVWAWTRAAVDCIWLYQSCVSCPATSRPPSPKASPKARANAATTPMNKVSTRFVAMPIWLIAMITANATIAISAIRPRSLALLKPIWP